MTSKEAIKIKEVMTNVSRRETAKMRKDPSRGPIAEALDHVRLKMLNDFLASVLGPLDTPTSIEGQSVAQPIPSKSRATMRATGFGITVYEMDMMESTKNARVMKNLRALVRSDSRPRTNGMKEYTALAEAPTSPTSKMLAPSRYASKGRNTEYSGSTRLPEKEEKSSRKKPGGAWERKEEEEEEGGVEEEEE